MTTREAFEKWAIEAGYSVERIAYDPDNFLSGQYKSILTNTRWAAWQAATDAALEIAIQACEVIETDRWALYKGRPPYTGAEPGRADNYVQGESGGAGSCASAIRALKDET